MTINADRPTIDPPQTRNHTVLNLLIGVVVLAAGLLLIFSMTPGSAPSWTSTASSGGSTSSSASGDGAVDTLPESVPTKVTVPSIGASSSLIETGLQLDGSLEVPPVEDPMQASWYDQSPTPGEVGPSVVLGHVNGNGNPGIFADLDQVRAGQEVLVDRADGEQAVFRVSRVETMPKSSFPTDSVYNDTPNASLRLITCGGAYDAANRNYQSNVIVYADLVDVRKI